MNFLRKVGAVAWKDLRAEWRTREVFSAMFVFALLIIIIFNFALELRAENARVLVPGILWVAFTFSGMLGLNRSFIQEKDRGSLEGLLLCPVDRSAIYLGKMLANSALMALVAVFILPVSFVLFNLSFGALPMIVVVTALGTVGFAGVGTLFSAMAVNTRAREVMLPLLLFPVAVPLIIAAVKLTAGIMDGLPAAELARWWQLLIGFDAIFFTLSFMTFDYVIEE
ncbi:MAG: heme exporter protein CcmB [Anaerolineales bacterium]